jgi:hypothetical protein
MRTGKGNQSTRRKNLPQFHFIHHKCNITWPGFEPGPPRFEWTAELWQSDVLTNAAWL